MEMKIKFSCVCSCRRWLGRTVLDSRDLAVGGNWKTFSRYRGGVGQGLFTLALASLLIFKPRPKAAPWHQDPVCSHGNFWLCLVAPLPWNVDSWRAARRDFPSARLSRENVRKGVSLTLVFRDDSDERIEPVEGNGNDWTSRDNWQWNCRAWTVCFVLRSSFPRCFSRVGCFFFSFCWNYAKEIFMRGCETRVLVKASQLDSNEGTYRIIDFRMNVVFEKIPLEGWKLP